MAALGVSVVRRALATPLHAAWGTLTERELVRVRLSFSAEDYGEGEAAPLEPYDGVPLGAVLAALDAYGAVLERSGPDAGHEELLAACRAERPLPQALAAIDLALWDRAGRLAGKPVAALLSDRLASSVPVNAVVGAEDRAGAAAAAAAAARDGFGCVKVKVGVGDDAGRLAAVRAVVGPDVAIRADANGAWRSPDEALAHLRALAPVGLELCEEPVHGVEALREVRAGSPVPVAMDETAAEPGAVASGAVDAVCLKIARCGGITGASGRRPSGARRPAPRSTSRRPTTGRWGSPPGSTPPPRSRLTGRSSPAASRRWRIRARSRRAAGRSPCRPVRACSAA